MSGAPSSRRGVKRRHAGTGRREPVQSQEPSRGECAGEPTSEVTHILSAIEQGDPLVGEPRSYVNPCTLENRYRGGACLHADADGMPGPALPFSDTTEVVGGETT